jgi:hypothetical protein
MFIPVSEAVADLDARGLLRRRKQDCSAPLIALARSELGIPLPPDLEAFYAANIAFIGDYRSVMPTWNERIGWKDGERLTELLHVQAVPIFGDGSGNLFGLDLTTGDERPAVYLFDHERDFAIEYAAGSSIGAFLLVLAETDRALSEGWPRGWELSIDPDINKCPRAPAVWEAA